MILACGPVIGFEYAVSYAYRCIFQVAAKNSPFTYCSRFSPKTNELIWAFSRGVIKFTMGGQRYWLGLLAPVRELYLVPSRLQFTPGTCLFRSVWLAYILFSPQEFVQAILRESLSASYDKTCGSFGATSLDQVSTARNVALSFGLWRSRVIKFWCP